MSEKELEVRGFRVWGRVQGVFFRVWTRELAAGLGLRGAVRNLSDGSVEAWAEGTAEVLDHFQEKLWEGPPSSRVEEVERTEVGGVLPEIGFTILY
jgi:acylphosphatase